jgi:hypothetical protein
VISKLVLPEDLMLDIFTLIPLYCLINSARHVCKSWAYIIDSFYFVEAYERAHPKPGLYVHNRIDQSLSYFLEFKDDVNGQFEINYLGTPPTMGHVRSSCDGMLVLSNYENQYFVVDAIHNIHGGISELSSIICHSRCDSQNVVEAWCYLVVRDPKENNKSKMEDEGEERTSFWHGFNNLSNIFIVFCITSKFKVYDNVK